MKNPGTQPLLLILMFAGCTVGPAYRRPNASGTNALPSAFSGAGVATNQGEWKIAEPGAHLPRGNWWSIFNDEELNRLEGLATGNNQQIAGAVARFDQARALVNVARADYFPNLSANPSYTRNRTSANQNENGQPAGMGHNFGNWTIPLDANWEADLWGRVRRQVEAARARLGASADDVQAINLSIQAEVAIDYFTAQLFDAEYALLVQSVQAYRRSLDLTRNRRVGGVVSDLDVAQAETQLSATEAQLPAVDLQRTKLRHALATLCGAPATGFELKLTNTNFARIPAIPLALPAELLERRPDIAAAERRMIAANADIGVAHTAFYPRLTFRGTAGFESIDIGTLFDWPSRFWAVGPLLELPLFTGGRNRARLAASQAAYHETVANYRQTVLSSFQEIEDQLAAQRLLVAQLGSETAALTAARRTLEIADNRYKAGLVTYLEVAIAQSAALTHEFTVEQLQAQRLAASAALAKALGGGWSQP